MLPLLYHTRRRHGFTLVELLVVILILAILLSVALPLYTASIADAEKKAARTNMQTIATAVAAYKIRQLDHSYPTKLSDLTNPPTGGPSDLSALPSGPGNRSYILLGIAGDTTASCFTPVAPNGTIQILNSTIPPGSFAVTTILTKPDGSKVTGGLVSDNTDDWCYIPGVSAE